MHQINNLRKIAISLAMLATIALGSAAVARADVFVVNTTIGDGNVNAQATFSGSGNLLTISLQNLGITSNIGTAISGIQFQICNAQGNVLNITGSITTQNNPLITVADGGAVSSLGTLATGWGLSSAGPSFTLTGLGFTGQTPNALPPDELIVGTLFNPNGSIAGNDPHNPLINGTGVFTLTLSQTLPAGFQICNVVFLFGTGPASVPAGVIPEPASMLLLGTGLIGFGAAIRSRRKATK